MKKHIVILAAILFISAQPPDMEIQLEPDVTDLVVSDLTAARRVAPPAASLSASLASPRANETQQQLLARFADNTATLVADVNQQQIQTTIAQETTEQQRLRSIAQQVMTPATLASVQLGPNFNWQKCFFKRGLTWRKKAHYCASGLDLVGCSGCNPYVGDTQCFAYRPILCIFRAYDVRPDYTVSNPFYEGWSGGHIKITPAIRGCYIFSKAHADAICSSYFGAGWGIASHHDGYYIWGMNGTTYAYGTWNWFLASPGGWNFYAYGNIATTPYNSYWTYISNQPGNCWN